VKTLEQSYRLHEALFSAGIVSSVQVTKSSNPYSRVGSR